MSAGPIEQQPNTAGCDSTTGAIYDVIQTMGGQRGENGAEPAPTPVDLPPRVANPESCKNRVVDLPAERINTVLEDRLISHGIFGKRSMSQRRVLGCVGCKLATQPGNTGSVRSMEIADCMGAENLPVRRILGKLVEGGFLKTEKRADPTRYGNPDYYRFTPRAVEFAFKRKLEIPGTCGLDQEGGNRLNANAESMLVEAGVLATKGSTARAILGCLACRLQAGDGVYVNGLGQCSGQARGHHQSVVQRLADGGVLQGRTEPGKHAGHNRIVYTPADTELGKKVAAALEIPPYCGLEDKQNDN